MKYVPIPVATGLGAVFAAGVTTATLALRLALEGPLAGRPTLVIFTVPIMLSAYFGGWRGGLLATGLAAGLASHYLLQPAGGVFGAWGTDQWDLFFVVVAGVVISGLNEALHRARRRTGVAVDLQRQAQAVADATLRSGAMHNAIFGSVNLISITTDAKGFIQAFNAGAERMLGYTAAEAIGRLSPADISDRQEMAARAQALSAEFGIPIAPGLATLSFKASRGMAYVYEPTLVRKDGSRFAAVVSVAALRDPHDQIIGYLLIGTDNTARQQVEETRRRAEALVRDSEQKLRKVIDGTGPDSFLGLLTAEGVVIEANRPALVAAGLQPEDVIGKPFDQTYWWSHSVAVREQLLATIARAAAGEASRYEVQVRVAAELLVWIDFSLNPVRDLDGRVIYLVPSGIVIDERVRAAEALRMARALQDAAAAEMKASEARYRTLFEYAPDGILIVDAAGRCLDANASMCRLLAGARDELIGLAAADIVVPSEAQHVGPALRELSAHVDHRREWQFQRRDGSRFAAAVVATQMPGGNVLAMVHDITERKRSEARLRRLVDSNVQGVMFWNREGTIAQANEAFLRIVGYSREELEAGRIGWAALTPPQYAEADRLALEEIDMRGICTPLEKDYIRKDGSLVPVMVGAAKFEDSPDEGVCFVIDMTERKQVEASLREAMHKAEAANRAKSDFLANTSHEIRTPMNAVMGLSYLLGQTALDEPQRKLLAKVELASKSLLGVLNNVLDLAKIEANELIVERAPFSLPQLLQELGDLMSVQSQAKAIRFEIDCEAGLPEALEGDAARLAQVLTNLLSNSIKFTDRGHVCLRVRRLVTAPPVLRLQFTVQDSGIGIAADVQQRLFEPFVQADASITRRFGGSGLGLSIVKHLVAMMGGTVRLQSRPGIGSEFTVTLDFGGADAGALEPPQAVPRRAAGRALAGVRVLVVDDSDINLEVTQRILQLEGAVVALASSGEQALELLRAGPAAFDLVLMDVQMPGLDGHDAARRIRGELGLAALPIIALSAGALSSARQQAIDAGMDDYLVKPFEAQTLVRNIQRHLGPAGQPHAAAAAAVPDTGAPADVSLEAPWQEVAGIDSSDARQRFGGDFVLFIAMLKRMIAEFADLTPAACDIASKPALALHGARMHKLRGSAGMLGARAVQADAGAAEAACAAGDGAGAGAFTRGLAALLQRLARAAEPSLAAAAAAEEEQEHRIVGSEWGASALAELIGMLRAQSLAALDRFHALAPQLRQQLGAERYARVRAQIDNLQFSEAADLLSERPATEAAAESA